MTVRLVMRKYTVIYECSGYSRGSKIFEVEAESEEEAISMTKYSSSGEFEACRNDMETDWDSPDVLVDA
jgi:hypothetical protein